MIHRLTRDMGGRASTGCTLPDEGNVYIDDDVFAEAEAEALA